MKLFDDRLLKRDEVEAYFGLSKRFLEVSAQRKQGPPFIRFGRSIRYRVADVRSWIEAHRVLPQAANQADG